jgi:hypothetical protein
MMWVRIVGLVSILVVNAFPQHAASQAITPELDRGGSQHQSTGVKSKSAIDPKIRSLLDDSEALPPEFASDVMPVSG